MTRKQMFTTVCVLAKQDTKQNILKCNQLLKEFTNKNAQV